MPLDPEQPFRFVGCSLVFPAGVFGAFMILDYPGPPSPLGFAEIFGWGALCVSLGILTGRLIAAFFERRRLRWLALLGAIAIPTTFTFLLWWDIHPDTPGVVKEAVEYALQGLGVVTIAGLTVIIVRFWRDSRTPRTFN